MIGGSLLIPLVLRSNLQCGKLYHQYILQMLVLTALPHTFIKGNSENTTGCSCQGNVNCTKLENDDYLNIAWSVSSDFPSMVQLGDFGE